jgi:hypothetical protein
MKYFLVVVICMWGQCENYLTTEPEFTNIEACREYSRTMVEKIMNELPDSAGTTYCFDEKQVMEMTNNLLKQQQEFLEQFNPGI